MKSITKLSALAAALVAVGNISAVSINSDYLFGKADKGSPSSIAREEERLEYFIGTYNGDVPAPTPPDSETYTTYLTPPSVPAPDLPLWDSTSTAQIGGGWTSQNIDVTGWTYLMVKWSDNAYYYYVGGLTGTHTIVNDVEFNKNGVAQNASHYRFFGPEPTTDVPDAGSSVILLGGALAALAGMSRFRKS